jgi:hypothetical protein
MPNNGTVYINPGKETKKESQQREVNEVIKEVDKLGKIIERTNNVIFELSSTFPFQLFPDRIIIDENKVTIVSKEFLFKRIFPIMYEDLLTVRVNRGILFAAMEFEVKRLSKKPRAIVYLNPKDATIAKQYIMGLVEAKKANVDLSKLTAEQIKERLEEIGKASEEVENLF